MACGLGATLAGMDSLLNTHRAHIGAPLAAVARAVGVNRSTLYRIEAGDVAPTRRVARALFEFYRGEVPLAHIYDPEFAARPHG